MGYSPWAHKQSDTTERLTLFHKLSLAPAAFCDCFKCYVWEVDSGVVSPDAAGGVL